MTKRGKTILVCLLLAFAAVLAWKLWREREPVYQGKSLGAWLDFVRTNGGLSPTGVYNPSGQVAVRAMRERALPILLRMMTTRDSAFRTWLVDLSLKEDWLQIHLRPRQEQQEMAVCGFALLGPTAKPALHQLTRLLSDEDPQTRCLAAYCLSRIGPEASEAVMSLTNLLALEIVARTNSEWDEKSIFCAAYALGEIGPAARPGVPPLEKLTNDSNWTVQGTAQASLIKITGVGMDQVLDSLKDTSNRTNWSKACWVVGLLGGMASNAIPLLLETTRDSDWHVQEKALEALGNIHSRPEMCLPTIVRYLDSTNDWVRLHAMQAIHSYGTNAQGLVPASRILACLADGSELVGREAASVLREIDPEEARKTGVPLQP